MLAEAGIPRATAFGAMLDTILAEADQYRLTLPRPADVIQRRAARHEGVLDEVTTPVLVHFDLWDGNILLDLDGGALRIGGLIDAERAFLGRPARRLRVAGAVGRHPAGRGVSRRLPGRGRRGPDGRGSARDAA